MKKIVLCGPSCSGKTTVKQELVHRGLMPSVSYTTRPIREGELEGQDYRFVSKKDFDSLASNGFFFEYDDTFDHCYGTSVEDFKKGEVFILTPMAIDLLKKSGLISDCFVVYLNAPMDCRIRRAAERGNSVVKILKRIALDKKTFMKFKDYHIEINSAQEDIVDIVNKILEMR